MEQTFMNRRTFISTVGVLFFILVFSAASAGEVKPDDIVGVWLIEEDGEAVEKVEIYLCEGRYCGEIVWIKAQEMTDAPVTDKKNKSEDKRERPLLGLEVMKNYEFDGDDTWDNESRVG